MEIDETYDSDYMYRMYYNHITRSRFVPLITDIMRIKRMPCYAAQRHVVYLWIRFAKEAMQHVSAPEPCRGQHSKCNDSNAEEVACSSVLCIKASALSNKFLPFSALLLALVLFLMYFPELITWWPSILGHYPKYFIWLVDPIATTKVKRNWRLRIIKGNNLVLCSLYQVSPQKFYV